MACGITEINQSAGSCGSDGGIYLSYGTSSENIVDVTYDTDGIITGLTMANTSLWGKLTFDTDEDTAFYNQTGERTGKKHVENQQAFMSFSQITAAKIKAANEASECCSVVFIHFLNSGVALVQGIDIDLDADEWRTTKQPAKVTVNALSDTGDNADRIEYTIDSVGRKLSASTTLTQTAIEAL